MVQMWLPWMGNPGRFWLLLEFYILATFKLILGLLEKCGDGRKK